MSNYTPGPWKPIPILHGVPSGIVVSEEEFICECSFNTQDGGVSNTRLISAAPEMYELLQKLYDGLPFDQFKAAWLAIQSKVEGN